MIPEPQYIKTIKKGHTVMYGNKPYRVQDDGRGYLHIIVFENRIRKKMGIDKLVFFEYGTEADWVFNNWYKIYPDYQVFNQFSKSEKAWLAV